MKSTFHLSEQGRQTGGPSFFASLHCRHPSLECRFILAAAGPIHVSFQLPAHQTAWEALWSMEEKGTPQHQALQAMARRVEQHLVDYLEGRKREFLRPPPSPFLQAGSPFQRRVWQLISAIPAGETRTYGKIATQLGDRALARAVGGACGANPCPLLIPCHRVVAAQGLGGFGGGLAIKARLLALELKTTTK